MNVQDESFMDTCVDVINYMVLLAAYLKDKDAENTSKPLDSNISGGKIGA
jgi:hypothetical protein